MARAERSASANQGIRAALNFLLGESQPDMLTANLTVWSFRRQSLCSRSHWKMQAAWSPSFASCWRKSRSATHSDRDAGRTLSASHPADRARSTGQTIAILIGFDGYRAVRASQPIDWATPTAISISIFGPVDCSSRVDGPAQSIAALVAFENRFDLHSQHLFAR